MGRWTGWTGSAPRTAIPSGSEWDDLVPWAGGIATTYYHWSPDPLNDLLSLLEVLRRTSVVGLAPFFSHRYLRFSITSEGHPDDEMVPVFIWTAEGKFCIHTGYTGEECPCVALLTDAAEAAGRFIELVRDWWTWRAGRAVPHRDRPWEDLDRWRGPPSVGLP